MKKITESNLDPFYGYRFVFANGKEYNFTSLAGAFNVFSSDEIGRTLKYLQHINLAIGVEYKTEQCSITKIVIYRLKRTRQ